MPVCMPAAGVKHVTMNDSCRSQVSHEMYDSCRSQVSASMTPAGVKYVSMLVCMTPAGVVHIFA